MKIKYQENIDKLSVDNIEDGFFEGWPNPPSKQKHMQILKNSYKIIVAVDEDKKKIIGFINCISDGIICAYIPLLEVIPAYRGKGIGKQLAKIMIDSLRDLYMIDVVCDENVQPFYEKLSMIKGHSMIYRNYNRQSGD
jgi:ribosomal protein S18 acetylase RimI-like enzyme